VRSRSGARRAKHMLLMLCAPPWLICNRKREPRRYTVPSKLPPLALARVALGYTIQHLTGERLRSDAYHQSPPLLYLPTQNNTGQTPSAASAAIARRRC
jgi:hypothetical protein